MLTLEQCRKIDPGFAEMSDEELRSVRDALYDMAHVAVESLSGLGSKSPDGLLPNYLLTSTMKRYDRNKKKRNHLLSRELLRTD